MRDTVELRDFYKKNNSKGLVLCTIVQKEGSSYRSLFAKKIVSLGCENSCGLLTGGCLEAEVEKVARQNVQRLPLIHTFNTMNEEDRLLGWQKGCSGVLDVLIEKLPEDLDQIDLYFPFGVDRKVNGVKISLNPLNLAKRHFSNGLEVEEDEVFENWEVPIQLSIVGCGTDADPYLEFCQTLGWTTRFIDYRRNLATPHRFSRTPSIQAEFIEIENIAEAIVPGPRSAILLMTHNFEADLNIFKNLVGKDFAYIGCLGPLKRYQLLKADLKKFFDIVVPPDWEKKVVKAPPGIMKPNHSAVEIALSVVTEIQMCLGNFL